jgi:Spy/CpxP family protein refolding chaperone
MDNAGADAVISTATRGKLLVFAVFLVGCVVGAVLDNLYETRWNADPDSKRSVREIQQLDDLLDLTPEQRQQRDSILEASRPDFEKLFAENRELLKPNNRKYADLQQQTRAKIRAILTEEQAKAYDEYYERRRQRGQRPRQD